MQCSSPLASIGFNILPASIAPSVLPAPTIRCSSSIKRMISPSDPLTSSRTAFSLSSNSPLYLAPATRAPISREKIFLSLSAEGTSPLAILCASASTTAVLPTPGSPIRTGLFLLFLERILMTFLISVSLPMTGSSFCCFAFATSSVPYLFSVSYVASGLSVLTFLLPRTSARTCRNLFLSMPNRESISLAALLGFFMTERNRCSTDT